MQYQEQVDGDKVFTGNVEILGQIQNYGLSRIATEVQKSRTEAQSVKADFKNFLDAVLSDGIIEPTEKLTIARIWAEIKTEYPIIRSRAIDNGLTETSQEVQLYELAYQALQDCLIVTPGILQDMKTATAVDKAEIASKFERYYIAREVINTEVFVTTFNEIAETVSKVFYDQPVGPYKRGDLWISDGILYQSNADRGGGEYNETDWEWCIRSNLTTVIESSNGTIFKPGESMSTILTARVFRNGLEITSEIPESRFRWRRQSFYPQFPPNDDATWNSNHNSGYKAIEVTAHDIESRATYFCDILE